MTLTSFADADKADGESFVGGLSPATQLALDQETVDDVAVAVERSGSGYCMVEAHDGEFAKLRIFHTVEGLVQRLVDLDGQDVVVVPFFGTPLPISKGPERYLLLPNDTAISITKRQQRVDLSEEEVEIEESGFIGPEALSVPAPDYVDSKPRVQTDDKAAPDEDFDDDDDDDFPT